MYKVFVDTGEPNANSNALTFDTVADAVAYAKDLFGRWMLVRRWFVIEARENAYRLVVDEAERLAEVSGA